MPQTCQPQLHLSKYKPVLKFSPLIVAAGFLFTFAALKTAADGQESKPEPATNQSGKKQVNFARQILPILSDKCFVCHGPDSSEHSDLRLDSYEEATRDLGGYRAIDPKHLDDSELAGRIQSEDDPMPPADAEKQLTDDERRLLLTWIQQGGKYSKHWAYTVPKRTKPQSDEAAKGSAAVDAFIRDQLIPLRKDLAKQADKTTLARRVSLTLTGLPPATDVLKEYLSDSSEDAYEKLVDRLLADPKYGEHQARYWLDAVRYGDTHGLHLDNRRGIFPYRDWVIKAFNDNLPFDKFVTWQLAGDLLPDPTLEQMVATGFVRMNPTTSEGGAIPAEFQAKNNFDRTENFGTVFLGMSLNCARCHTHKYDPIPQTEYYRLLAFFNSTAERSMDGNSYTYAPIIKAPANQAQWRTWTDLSRERDQIIRSAKEELKALAAKNSSDSKPKNEFAELSNAPKTDQLKRVANSAALDQSSKLVTAAKDLLADFKNLEKQYTTTLVAKELPKPRVTKRLRRGEYNLPEGEALEPGVIKVARLFPQSAPRNRLGLAQWLLAADNPLTSRVLINRVWQRVFGHALVRTPEDFGLQGQQPTHPELLDWLAVEFRESGWDLKKMIKTMVMSRTFRQSSAWRQDINDPENKLFARGPAYRLDAEVLRDIALWGSGLMADEKGGEGIKPYQPPGMWKALAHPASNTKQYKRDQGERLYRRTVYVYWKRTSPHPMMTLFDAPSRESSCVRRSRTNTSLQSLGLFNETQRIELGRKFAERLMEVHSDDEQRLNQLYLQIVSRIPTKLERSACLELLRSMKDRYTGDPEAAKKLIATGEAPQNKELNPVNVAAWTQVIMTVLASDAAIMVY